MSRDYHYHHEEFELWVVGPPPWTYDLRTPEQSRERQKRDWKKKNVNRNLQNFAADFQCPLLGVKQTSGGWRAL
jgi:hypothetical protein